MLAVKESVDYASSRVAQPIDRRRAAPVVERARGLSWTDKFAIAASIAFCMSAGWYVAGAGAKIDLLNASIDRIQTQIQRTAADNASLSTQVDELKSPSRILGIVMGRFKGQFAHPVQIQKH